jgi:predicted transcriptional regulator
MAGSTTLTVRVTPKVKQRLGRLAHRTKRTKSFLAAEAIADYVGRELDIVDGIKRGLADIEAARLVPHDKAMRRVRGTIERTRKAKRNGR